MTSSPTFFLNELNRLIDDKRFKQANDLFVQYRNDNGDQAAVNADELRLRIREGANAAQPQIKAQLDELLNQPVDTVVLSTWTDTANDLLEQLDQANVSADRALAMYANLVTKRLETLRDQTEYQEINRQVDAIYTQTTDLIKQNPKTPASTLIKFYTDANTLAQDAHAASPNNPYLEALAQKTEKRRADLGTEEALMTSGAQLGQYEKTFRYVISIDDSDMVMVYNENNIAIGRMKKVDALAETYKQARIYVKSKTNEYIDEAEKRLRDFRPREALEQLNQYVKFHELDQFIKEFSASIFEPEQIKTIELTTNNINIQLERLESAETIADSAKTDATNNTPRSALNKYLDALRAYEGAVRSTKIKEAHAEILRAAQTEINDTVQKIGSLYNQNVFDKADAQGTELVNAYNDLISRFDRPAKDFANRDQAVLINVAQANHYKLIVNSLTDMLEPLITWRDNAHTAIDNLKKVADGLKAISTQAVKSPKPAADALVKLEGDYPDLIALNPDYERIKSQVGLRVNATAELERLRDLLTSTDAERVQAGLALVRSYTKESATHSSEFSQLALELDAYLVFLSINDVVRNQGYQPAVKTLEELLDRPGLPETLRSQFETKQQLLEEESQHLANNSDLFAESDGHLKDDPGNAYQILKSVQPLNAEERQRRDTMLGKASNNWKRQIVKLFDDIAISKPLASNEIKAMLNTLDELDATTHDKWKPRLQNPLMAQDARDESNPANALEIWKGLEQETSGGDRIYVRKQIIRLEKLLKRQAIEAILHNVQDQGDTVTTEDDSRLAMFIGMTDELRATAAAAEEPIDKVDYSAWYLQVLIGYAQYTPDLKKRLALFDTALNSAKDLDAFINRTPLLQSSDSKPSVEEARRQINIALQMPKIGKAMEEVEKNLSVHAELADFARALGVWQNSFTSPDQFPALQRWYDTLVNRLRESIQSEKRKLGGDGGTTLSTNTANMGNLLLQDAKLLILFPEEQRNKMLLETLKRDLGVARRNFDQMKARITSGQVYTTTVTDDLSGTQASASGTDAELTAQLDSFKELHRYLKTIEQVAAHFRNTDALKGDGDALITHSRAILDEVERVINELTAFQKATSSFEGFLKSIDIGRDNEGRDWHQTPIRVKATWDTLNQNVSDINDTLRDHPRLGKSLKDSYETFTKNLKDLVEALEGIQEAVKREKFSDAQTSINYLSTNQVFYDLISDSSIVDTFSITDTLSGGDITGWDQVKQYIKTKDGQLDTLLKWGKALGAPAFDDKPKQTSPADSIALRRTAEQTSAKDNLPPNMVDWKQYKEDIAALTQAGQFDEAHRQLAYAWKGEGKKSETPYALEEVLLIAQTPPMATNNGAPANTGDVVANFAQAVQTVGSNTGKNILSWVESIQLRHLNSLIEEAQAVYKKINDDNARWTGFRNDFNAALRTIAVKKDIANKSGGLFNRGKLGQADQVELQQAVAKADVALTNARGVCPTHNELNNMQNHAFYIWGKRQSNG